MLFRVVPAEEAQYAAEQGSFWDGLRSKADQAQGYLSSAVQPRQRDVQDDAPQTIRYAAPLPSPSAGTMAGLQSSTGTLAIIAAAAGILLVVFRGKLTAWLSRGGQRQQGRWIRDRSLGGKEVFIPAEELPSRKRTNLWDDDEPSSAAPAAAPVSPAALAAARAESEQQSLPAWWNPAPRIPASSSFHQSAESKARAILRGLEEAKLSGTDYSVPALAELRETCTEASVTVKPRTASGGEALYKAAMEEAARTACEGGQNPYVWGVPATRFVASMAAALGIADHRAVTMANGITAAKSQSILVEVLAAMRDAQRRGEVLHLLLSLKGLTATFPLPPASAQAEMVASRLSSRASLNERQAVLQEFFSIDSSTADRVAELLGFNPELVLPTLQQANMGGSDLAA
ncbi:hypothetical protein WJX73_005603 [Symbiochloris irregularis]|uniref:Uncharacterized protein n=1 Tax=Symbiochloris irregularis TaxID=706552 RepID=A0AAW1PJ13_9CHLO